MATVSAVTPATPAEDGSDRRGRSRPSVGGLPAGARRPVLIVQVDVAEAGGEDDGSRCEVRMVPSVGQPSVEDAWAAARDGISVVVILRNATPSSVFSCVTAAVGDGEATSAAVANRLPASSRERRPYALDTELTGREFDVLRMLADGESTRGIAERLNYSERTVKSIVHDLLEKMGCRTRAHAVALATRQGVI